jgi:pilus assembly protein CpaB
MNGHDISELLARVRRAVEWHRSLISALLVGVAAVCALTAVTPRHTPTRPVWTAARDLSGGGPLRADDIVLRRLPLPLVPAGALGAGARVVGRMLAAPMRRGEPLTDVRLLAPPLLAALDRPGLVAVPVRVADGAAAAALTHPGDVVDVLATADLDGASANAPAVVAAAVTVLSVPGRDATGEGDAGLVVVAVTPEQAAALATAAAGSRLSLVLRRP